MHPNQSFRNTSDEYSWTLIVEKIWFACSIKRELSSYFSRTLFVIAL